MALPDTVIKHLGQLSSELQDEPREIKIKQLRANRTHAVRAWCGGMDSDDWRFPRWDGDDNRPLDIAEFQFWPEKIQAAQKAHFAELDAAYEQAKEAL